ncbi:MAG TPA: glutathione peroxidase [Thermoanaerobaculales bacterium]|nr:glutathione peroxidase [Thermoanaerobaculales bacterium]HPA82731.1 glutathione peroxidase [Thermoanaerobaculales bacterium]HQL31011.1 glutathione peroxidase [Thermoanaerobaculales bacterium]HQN96628.1 glutathione peroxidase [Thermoanaerobaculales bacterium]HQP45114.1 glutathione peroxidase [Thermoanaerobaculales bacterium]
MKYVALTLSFAAIAAAAFLLAGPGPQAVAEEPSTPAVINHTVSTLEGESLDLSTFRGKPMLIVNTASKCGYTPQFAGLQKLHERYGERGLVVVGFPCNDFMGQDPGTAVEIGEFCRRNYGVTFPMMAKVHVKGKEKAPIYRTLTEDTAEDIRGEIKWNFTKFLVDADGHVVARFGSSVEPEDPEVIAAIEKLLPKV